MTIKEWYLETYPEDDLGEHINNGVTFSDLCNALTSGKDIYGVIGVGDSLVRERFFHEVANQLQTTYTAVYDMWLHG